MANLTVSRRDEFRPIVIELTLLSDNELEAVTRLAFELSKGLRKCGNTSESQDESLKEMFTKIYQSLEKI